MLDYGRRVDSLPVPSGTSVIVVTWNGEPLLAACLDSLHAQQALSSPLEVIVVDNGSTDSTQELLATHYPWVRVISLPENFGFAGGANAGIAAATGEFVGLLNNDAVADPHFVARAVATLHDHPEAAAVTALILLEGLYERIEGSALDVLVSADGEAWRRSPTGTTLVNGTGGEVTRSANGRDRDWLVSADQLERETGTVPGFSGGGVVLRRAALDEVGMLDDRLFMYYEDSDLSWRLRRAGWEVLFERDAVVVHQHAASSGTSTPFFLFHNERNRLLFALKHGTAPIIAAAYCRTLASIARALLNGDRRAAARKTHAVGASLRRAVEFLADRRSIDRTAAVSRREMWRGAPPG